MQRLARPLAACALAASLALATPAHADQGQRAARGQLRPATGLALAQTALAYVGSRYSTYGSSPATGFSCVGLVTYVYRQYGYWLPGSVAGIAVGYPYVAPGNLQPGDLLLFTGTEPWAGYTHVAIYIGGGRMVGADNFTVGVHVDNINDPYWSSHWVRSVRVLS